MDESKLIKRIEKQIQFANGKFDECENELEEEAWIGYVKGLRFVLTEIQIMKILEN